MLFSLVQCKNSVTGGKSKSNSDGFDLIAPKANSEQSIPLTFEWKDVDTADSFQIQLSTEKEFTTTLVDSTVNSTKFSINGLPYDTTIYWKARPIVQGQETKWSEVYAFTTEAFDDSSNPDNDSLAAPVQVLPNDGASDVSLKPTFEWKTVDGADEYILHVSYGDQMAIEEEIKSTTYTPTNDLTPETTHYWRIRAVKNGNEGKWSDVMDFKTRSEGATVPAVTLVSPSDGAANQSTSPTLEWEELSEINNYQVQLATSSEFSSPIVDEATSAAYFDATGLENNRQYYWRVQASGDNNNSNWSSTWNFTTEEAQNTDDPTGGVSSDRAALMDLYEATGGDSWHNNSGWGSGDPSGSWHGIETDANGRVVRIDLFKNNLQGQLPASIGDLTKVRYLNVKNNYLTGEIPPEIGNMASLEWLILQGRTYEVGGTLKEPPSKFSYGYHQGKNYSNTNEFRGQIPSEIGNLSNLEILELSNAKQITGPIPPELGNLTKLKGLYMSGNDFQGYTIPSPTGNLVNLKHVYIEGAGLVGELPASWRNLTKLTYINLGVFDKDVSPNNSLTGNIPDFSQFTELRSIVFTKNDFTGKYPHYWNNGNFQWLHTIGFAWNNLTGTLHGFENLPHIASFNMPGNELTGSIAPLTSVRSGVKIISVGWNNLSGDFPQTGWPDFSQIKTVYMNKNSLSGDIPCSFWEKLDNPKLHWAWFQNNEFVSTCESSAQAMEGSGSVDLGL